MSEPSEVGELRQRVVELERRMRFLFRVACGAVAACAGASLAAVALAQQVGTQSDPVEEVRLALRGSARANLQDAGKAASIDDVFIGNSFIVQDAVDVRGALGMVNGKMSMNLFDDGSSGGLLADSANGQSHITIYRAAANPAISIGVDASGTAFLRMYDRVGRLRFRKQFR